MMMHVTPSRLLIRPGNDARITLGVLVNTVSSGDVQRGSVCLKYVGHTSVIKVRLNTVVVCHT